MVCRKISGEISTVIMDEKIARVCEMCCETGILIRWQMFSYAVTCGVPVKFKCSRPFDGRTFVFFYSEEQPPINQIDMDCSILFISHVAIVDVRVKHLIM